MNEEIAEDESLLVGYDKTSISGRAPCQYDACILPLQTHTQRDTTQKGREYETSLYDD
jgi:hypothetical protein